MCRTILHCTLLLLCYHVSLGQGAAKSTAAATSTASTTYIIYNYKYAKVNPDAATFPIDQPFTFEIDSIPAGTILNVFAYPMQAVNGYHHPYDVIKDEIRPSFELKGNDTSIYPSVIILKMPAIKSGMKFDVSIVKQFSPDNLTKALTLDKLIDQHLRDHSLLRDPVTGQILFRQDADKKTADDKFCTLFQSVNGFYKYSTAQGPDLNFLKLRNENGKEIQQGGLPVEIRTINGFAMNFYDNDVSDAYELLVAKPAKNNPDLKPLPALDNYFINSLFLNQGDVSATINAVQPTDSVTNHIYALQLLLDNPASLDAVMTGQLPVEFSIPVKYTDLYDFIGRKKNLTTSLAWLRSVWKTVNKAEHTNPGTYGPILTKLSLLIVDLDHNNSLLSTKSKFITDRITIKSTENVWVSGQSTASPDMITQSARIFAVDFGVINMFARDNSGNFVYMPRFFLAADIYLQAFDKNADWTEVRKVNPNETDRSHLLEAQQSFKQRFSFTFGLAFGNMTDKDLTNSFSSFSVSAGANYRFGKYLKLGAGTSLIHRYDNNPLLAEEARPLLCPYASLSVDLDILNSISNVISNLTK